MGNLAARSIEERRIEEQTRLDCLKTAAERNKWGQFATPAPLAVSLAKYARTLTGEERIRFLDPAIGTGSFFSALRREFAAKQIEAAAGVELDPLFADTARDLWEEQGLLVTQGDFTRQRPPERRFNLILANPPYVRHHHMAGRLADSFRVHGCELRRDTAPVSHGECHAGADSPLLPFGRSVHRRTGIVRRCHLPKISAAVRPQGAVLFCRAY